MTLWQRQENFVCNRRFPFLPYCCVHSLIATNRITKPFMTLWQLQEYLVRNRTFLFLPYYCVHSPIVTNRTTKPFMTVRQQQEYLVRNRIFQFLLYYCLHFPIATNRITKPNAANFNCKHKNGRHDFSCLPLIVSIVYPVKPHCKAK